MNLNKLDSKTTGIINFLDLRKPAVKAFYYILLFISCCIAFVCLAPPLWVFLSSLKNIKEFAQVPPTIIPHTFEPQKIITTWKTLNFTKYYINSFIMVAGSVVCAIVFNGLAGYVISIIKPRGYRFVFNLILWSLMIPATINLVPIFKNIVALKLNNSYIPLWLTYGANAFYVLLFKNFFDEIPREVIEAAKIDGCPNLRLFCKIVMPLSVPIIMVVTIFSINASWSDFLLPYIVLKNRESYTVMIKIYEMSFGNTWMSADMKMLAVLYAILPPVVLVIFFQKYLTQGVVIGSLK
jgi:multiple sugar transport system permease protein